MGTLYALWLPYFSKFKTIAKAFKKIYLRKAMPDKLRLRGRETKDRK